MGLASTFRAVVVILTAVILSSTHAQASECTDRVFDTTGKADVKALSSALSKLTADGADPLIRVVTNDQYNAAGNLDKYTGSMVKRCLAWQSPGGNIKSNLLVLVVAPGMDSNSNPIGIYFSKHGPFAGALQGQTAAVRREMSTKFSSDITGSILAGVTALHEKISQAKITAPVAGNINGNVTVINKGPEKPTNFTPLYVILVLGVLAGLVVLVYRRRAAIEARRGAQQTAQGRRNECNGLILTLEEDLKHIEAFLTSLKSILGTTELDVMRSRFEAIKGRVSAAMTQFANMQTSANDPDSEGRSISEYESMTEDFERIRRVLNPLSAEVGTLGEAIQKVRALKDGAQPAIEAMASEIERATAQVSEEKTINTSGPKETLKRAVGLLERANTELEERRYQAVTDTCRDGTRLAQQAIQQLRDLRARRSRLESTIQQLERENLQGTLATADDTITSLRASYGETVVQQAQELRGLIVRKLEERRQALISARSLFLSQNWEASDTSTHTAQGASDTIKRSIASLVDLGPSIERQREAAARATSRSSRPSSNGYGHSHSHHSHTTNNIIVGGNPYGRSYDPIDDLARTVDRIELAEERDELRRERQELREERFETRSRRSDDSDLFGGDSGPTTPEPSLDLDIGGDSGGPSLNLDIGGGNDDD